MGSFFTNIHIKKNNETNIDTIKECLHNEMKKNGYSVANNESKADGCMIIYMPKESKWISICSDLIEFNSADNSKLFIESVSNNLNTDVMSVGCFDSDYLFVNLINKKENIDGWLNIGRSLEIPNLRRNSFSAWKDRVQDLESLKMCVKTEYVFVEEAMEHIGQLIELPYVQGCISEYSLQDIEDVDNIFKIYYSMGSENIMKEPSVLKIDCFSLCPRDFEKDNVAFVVNKGGKSRGIGVAFTIDYKEKEEIMFKDVYFEYNLGKEKRTQIPIKLRREQMPDGRWMYWWEDRNFQIPPKANQNLNFEKMRNIEFERCFGVRFTPYGNKRKCLDIKVTFIPLENVDGQCTGYMWMHNESKKAFVEDNNNRWNKWGDMGKENLLNPDDFDL